MRVYYVYILTSPGKKILYIGVTNSMSLRLKQHLKNKGQQTTWAGKYYCYKLIYYETFLYIDKAIAREKQLKN